MVPKEVTSDPKLQHRDTRVYEVLAGARRGPFVNMGERLIADSLPKVQRRALRESLKRLAAAGHIKVIGESRRGQRARYRLTSPLFGVVDQGNAQPHANHATEALTPRQSRSTLLRCGKCGQNCRGLLKVGWCRSCNWNLKQDRRIDKKLDERGVPRRKTFDELAEVAS